MSIDVHRADLFSTAARVAQTHPARVILPALAVFSLGAAGDTLLVDVAEHEAFWPIGLLIAVAQSVAVLGLTFYAGLLDNLVGAVVDGRPAPALHQVLRSLPLLRLLAADVILVAVATVSTGFLVIPGLVLFTFFAIVGPLITSEDHGLVQAFRRSARLVRPRFWLVLGVITLPLAIERELLDILEAVVGHEAVWFLYLTHLAVGIPFGVVIGLLEVALAEHLRRNRLPFHDTHGP